MISNHKQTLFKEVMIKAQLVSAGVRWPANGSKIAELDFEFNKILT